MADTIPHWLVDKHRKWVNREREQEYEGTELIKLLSKYCEPCRKKPVCWRSNSSDFPRSRCFDLLTELRFLREEELFAKGEYRCLNRETSGD